MSRRESDMRDDELHAFLREALTRRGFLRRSALGAGGLVLGNSILAACGGGKEGAPAAGTGAGATGGSTGKTLRISNWPLYIDKQTVPDFEKATGIKTEYTEDINDNGEFFAKIDEPLKRNQSIDRDVIVLTDWMAGRLITLGYVAPLDDAKFPNKANLVDNVKDVSFDPGRKYSVPWLSGMTGVGYNPKKTGQGAHQHQRHLRPQVQGAGHHADGDAGHARPGDARHGQGPDHRRQGRRRGGRGQDQEGAPERPDPQVHRQRLRRGPRGGQHRRSRFAWSGDIQGLAADNPDLRWIAPKEGAMLYSDNMMIPKTSDRQDLAMAWINYVYDPKHSAQIVAGAPYLSAVKGAGAELAKIAPELAKSPLVNPPDDLRSRGSTCSGR